MSGLKERLQKTNWREIFIVVLIFVLAFGIRAYLLRYDLMFEFDTYWHARMTGEIIQYGTIPVVDPLAYTHLPDGSPVPTQTALFWYISAFFYSITALFATGSFAYNKELLIEVVKFLPAFFGALVSVGLYLLGKEAYNKKAGYLMAFFGAVSSSFIYRTMAGFFEAGSLGYVFLVFGFYFFLRAVKRMEQPIPMAINGLIAAILFGVLSGIYALYQIVLPLLLFYAVFTCLAFFARGQKEKAIRLALLTVGVLIVFVLFSFVVSGSSWVLAIFSELQIPLSRLGSLAPVLVIFVLGAAAFLLYKKYQPVESHGKKTEHHSLELLKVVLLIMVLLGTFAALASPRERVGLTTITVGEESPGHLYFFHKFSILVFFPVLALLFTPFIDWKKKEVDLGSMLWFPFIAISLFMAWDRLHYSFNFGVPLAIGAGYIFFHALSFFEKRPRSERAIAGFLLGFLTLAGVASATLFTMNNTPTIELDTGWKEGLAWLKDNSPQDAKLFNWWDEGHWISFLAERKVITDNRNFDQYANSDVGKFVLTNDLNEAIAILKKYDSDYLVLGSDLLSKRNSMVLYAYYVDHPEQFRTDDPRLDPVANFQLSCSKQETNGSLSYYCSGNTISVEQMNSIPTTWTEQVSTFENNRTPIFYYRTPDNTRIFKISLKQNQAVFSKIWFHAPEMQSYFEEVFPNNLPGYSNKDLKIFKIHKENFLSQ